MPHELEYIVDQAVMLCDEGIKPDYFNSTHNANVKINGCKVCTVADKIPITNIPAFGICQKTQQPCVPAPLEWKDTYKVKVKGNRTLLFKSSLPCGLGGKIEFVTSGQAPITREDLDKMVEENAEEPPEEEEEEDGLSWWDAVELVPFVGGVVGMVRSGIKGDWVGFGINAFSLVLDIGGLFTGGAGNVASATIKGARIASTGIKAASKTTNVATKVVKAALTAGGKLLTKASAKAAAKALAKNIDDTAIKYGKICVFACFPAGTPVHIKQGIKKIEDIREGDLVWSQEETNGEISLKKVSTIIRREIDATVQIELEGETIETTAEHPFYTKQGWKDAADLTEQDHIQTKNKKWYRVKGQNFLYTKKKVYNFEVEDWHTYFVGKLAWLVHNAQPCFSTMIRESQTWFQNIMRGRNFNLAMNLFTKGFADDAGKAFYKELYVKLAKGGTKSGMGYVDSFVEGIGIIERKATDLSNVAKKTAESYIRDAAKYKNAISNEIGNLGDKVYLHVNNMKGVSEDILKYASDKGVSIIDDISVLFKK